MPDLHKKMNNGYDSEFKKLGRSHCAPHRRQVKQTKEEKRYYYRFISI
jgi:hypothetical protein